MEPTYKSYDDWYDHGPGSEAFKRKCMPSNYQPGQVFPDLTPKPKRAEDPYDIFAAWAKGYWEKPLVFETLMKNESDARINALIFQAKDIVVTDTVSERRARTCRELDKMGKDVVWNMAYRGDYGDKN